MGQIDELKQTYWKHIGKLQPEQEELLQLLQWSSGTCWFKTDLLALPLTSQSVTNMSLSLCRLHRRLWLSLSSLRFLTSWFLISKWEASTPLNPQPKLRPPNPKPGSLNATPALPTPTFKAEGPPSSHSRVTPLFRVQPTVLLANHNEACQPIRMP